MEFEPPSDAQPGRFFRPPPLRRGEFQRFIPAEFYFPPMGCVTPFQAPMFYRPVVYRHSPYWAHTRTQPWTDPASAISVLIIMHSGVHFSKLCPYVISQRLYNNTKEIASKSIEANGNMILFKSSFKRILPEFNTACTHTGSMPNCTRQLYSSLMNYQRIRDPFLSLYYEQTDFSLKANSIYQHLYAAFLREPPSRDLRWQI